MRYYLVKGEFDKSGELIKQFDRPTGVHENGAHRIWVDHLTCMQYWYQGLFRESVVAADRGIAGYRPEKHQSFARHYSMDAGVNCYIHRAMALWVMGYPEQAEKEILDTIAHCNSYSGHFMSAWALCVAGWIYDHMGSDAKAGDYFDRAIELSQNQDIDHWSAVTLIYQDSLWVRIGRIEKGMDQIRRNIEAHEASGAELIRGNFIFLLAEAYGQLGDPDRGLTQLDTAFRRMDRLNERWWEADTCRLKGDLLLMKADLGEARLETMVPQAEVSYLRALDVARRQAAKSQELRAAISLARLWNRQDKQAEAGVLLSDVYEWFTEGFETKDMKAAQALLLKS